MSTYYPVAMPVLNGNEKKYVLDCIDSTWISSNGKYIDQLEQSFSQYCNTKHAIACSNGTTALHLALMAQDVKQGMEVIVPTFTFVSTANAVTYCGAKPVFVDSEPDTWNMDPAHTEKRITPRTKGLIVVHLYGHPVDMDPILHIAKKHGLFIIEDAAEALGAEYKGKRIGSLGDSAIFSLFGNKIITTGEGGIITTNNDTLAEKIRILKGQGMDPGRRYWHSVIGYNYRMTNVQAAIGCAQFEKIQWHVEQRIRIAKEYGECLKHCPLVTLPIEKGWAKNVFWMFSILLKGATEKVRDGVMDQLKENGIETRPFFYPMHVLPPYKDLQSHTEFPVANRLCAQGLNLPSYGSLTKADIQYISEKVQNVLTHL